MLIILRQIVYGNIIDKLFNFLHFFVLSGPKSKTQGKSSGILAGIRKALVGRVPSRNPETPQKKENGSAFSRYHSDLAFSQNYKQHNIINNNTLLGS
jgi:hypothetical protein